jgi:protease I
MTQKILAVLAPQDFRDEEFTIPKEYWESKGANVMTISSAKKSVGRFGTEITNDFLFEDNMEAGEYDAIFFVGGGGCLDFMDNETAKSLTQSFVNQNKIVSAICAAPRLLLHWKILEGKKITGWNGDNKLSDLAMTGKATYTGDPVTVDEKYITADGPDSAEKFAKALFEALKK